MYSQQNNSYPPALKNFWADYAAKRQVRGVAWAVAIPCYAYFLVIIFRNVILEFLAFKAGMSAQDYINLRSEPATGEIIAIVFSLIFMTVPFIICAKIYGYNISKSAGYNKPKKGTVLPHLLFGLGFCSFANIAVSAAGDFLEKFGFDYSVTKGETPQGVFGFLLVVISTVIVPGILEEFAFRGIVLGLLRPFGDAFAIIASSAVFGILHGNFEQMPFAFLVGLVLGFIRVKSGSVAVPMAVHAANNLISVVLTSLKGFPVEWLNLAYTVYVLISLTAAILGVVLIKNKGEFTFKAPEELTPPGKKYKCFFFSPPIILVCVLYCALAVWYF